MNIITFSLSLLFFSYNSLITFLLFSSIVTRSLFSLFKSFNLCSRSFIRFDLKSIKFSSWRITVVSDYILLAVFKCSYPRSDRSWLCSKHTDIRSSTNRLWFLPFIIIILVYIQCWSLYQLIHLILTLIQDI